ncbi:hypothetical protein [Streptomyces sp. RP5T]|nr:hypothetical protein [Streptomyces sp. RP5T]
MLDDPYDRSLVVRIGLDRVPGERPVAMPAGRSGDRDDFGN